MANNLFTQALTDAAVGILKKSASGENISDNELKIILCANKMNQDSPLEPLLEIGKNILPLFLSGIGE